MSIAIFCAMREEFKPLARQLVIKQVHREHGSSVWRARMGSEEIYLVRMGPGKKNAQKTAQAFFEKYQPTRVLVYGFAGALSPDLSIGDLLFVDRVRFSGKSAEYICDGDLFEKFKKASYHQKPIFQGTLLTASKAIQHATEKKKLFEEGKALAVDMESAYIAQYAYAKRIPFNVIRAITDCAHEDLDFDFNRFMKKTGTLRYASLFLYCLGHPSKFKSLFQLARAGRLAAKNLTNFVYQILYQWTNS